jgi:hypothetical protein
LTLSDLSSSTGYAFATPEAVIRFESLSDIINRKYYVPEIDPAVSKVHRIIGVYKFRDSVRCGKSSCHAPHNIGVVVETDDGHETNIGHVCGARHFGDDFSVLVNRANRQLRNQDLLSLVVSTRAQAAAYLTICAELRVQCKGVDWLYKTVKEFRENVPDELIRRLIAMTRRGNADVVVTRSMHDDSSTEATLAKRRQGARTEGKTIYWTEVVGRVQGHRLWEGSSARVILEGELEKPLRELMALNPAELDDADLRKWSQWAETLSGKFGAVKMKMQNGVDFFTSENFDLIAQIELTQRGQRFDRQAWRFSAQGVRFVRGKGK